MSIKYKIKLCVKKILVFIFSAVYYFSKEPKKFKYSLAISAIMKNEGAYLDEWIKYHICAGVEKFYLYDNESSDNTHEILEPYIKSGIVELKYFPGKTKQLAAYRDAIKNHKHECEFMAMIDCDEFIRPIEQDKNIYDVVKNIIPPKNKRVAGLAVGWRLFGSSGYVKTPTGGGVLSNFLHRETDEHNTAGDVPVKVIVNPRRIFLFANPHVPLFEYGNIFYVIDQYGNKIHDEINHVIPSKICIHHYFTKSKEEFLIKRARGRADIDEIRSLQDFEHFDFNDVYDDSMLFYVEKIKRLTK